MWTSILLSVVSFAYDSAKSEHKPQHNLGFTVGDYFHDLDDQTLTYLNNSQHFDVDNSKYTSTRDAPNTDGCFVFSVDCQPDYVHHIYRLPIREHVGHFYTITFSYNYRVLKIENSFLKG